MKKRLCLLLGAPALCTLALFAIYCDAPVFDNPLDEIAVREGTVPDTAPKWLWAIDDTSCRGLMDIGGVGFPVIPPYFTGCQRYIQNYYFNPAVPDTVKKEWYKKYSKCSSGEDNFTATRVGPNSVTLYYWDETGAANHPRNDSTTGAFEKWMVKDGLTPWDSVLSFPAGIGITPSATLTIDGSKNTAVTVTGKTPPLGENGTDKTYIILYEANKLKCGSETEYVTPRTDIRTIVVKKYVQDNTTVPVIIFCDSYPDSLIVNKPLPASFAANGSEIGNCVNASPGSSVPVRTINGVSPGVINNTAAGNVITVTYSTTKTLIINMQPKDTTVHVTKTIRVVPEPTVPGNDPPAVIVLSKYTYTNLMINGKAFTSPDTAYPKSGGVNAFTDKGASAYYVKNGANVTINESVAVKKPGSMLEMDDGQIVSYSLEAKTGEYAKAAGASRRIYPTIGSECWGASTVTVSFLTLAGAPIGTNDTLVIPPGTPWSDPMKSFSVIEQVDEDGTLMPPGGLAAGYKFGIDYGTLVPESPAAGNYKITYIGLKACSGASALTFTTKERPVAVR